MKLTFIIADLWRCQCLAEMANIKIQPTKRTATIDLTDEQIAVIGIKQVGSGAGENKYEEILEVFVDE